MSGFLLSILSLVVVLGVLVFVHELGHFLAAKASGMYVHRFSLGMGTPVKALSFTRGETEYAISWLPLGGYVKVASREEDPASGALEGGPASIAVPPDRVYEAKPIWKRAIFILAGVTMNVLFAWIVFTGLNYHNGVSVYPVTKVGDVARGSLPKGAEGLAALAAGDSIVRVAGAPVDSWDSVLSTILTVSLDSFDLEVAGKPPIPLKLHRDALEARLGTTRALVPFIAPVIGQVIPGGPAAKVGVKVGDTLVAVDGRPVTQWPEVVSLVEAAVDKDVRLTLGRAGGRVEVTPHTLVDTITDSTGTRKVGKLRLGPGLPERHEPLTLFASMGAGWKQTVGVSTQIVRVVRGMFSGRVSTREIGGPIAIGIAAGQSAAMGMQSFLAFMAMISVNLAVVNMLPIPVLDGGQLLFLIGEAVLRRPLSTKLRERLTLVGLVLIVLLMVLAFSNDIRRALGLM